MPNPRQTILETLCRRGPLSVDEIAAVLKLSKMATRYHLGMLARDRLVVRQPADRTGCVGRPKGLYTLGDKASDRLAQTCDQFAANLLDEIEQSMGTRSTLELLQRTGQRVAATAPTLSEGAGERQRWSRAARFLSQRGYAARWLKESERPSLVVGNCPYHKLTRSHRHVCAMDMAMVESLLGHRSSLDQCIARGHKVCRFTVDNR